MNPTSPPTALELARALAEDCVNPMMTVAWNVGHEEVQQLARAVLDLTAERDAAHERMVGVLDATFSVGDGTAQKEIERLTATVARLTGENERLKVERDAVHADYIRAHHAGGPMRTELRLAHAQRDRLRSALVEACDIAEHLADLRKAEHTAALVKIDELRLAADKETP